jgi:hypothetical protein
MLLQFSKRVTHPYPPITYFVWSCCFVWVKNLNNINNFVLCYMYFVNNIICFWRNKVNNMKKIAKEKFENNLDNFLLNNSSNPKMYWSIISFSVICISLIILFVFESNCGRVTFSSSSFDIELKYLFNNSHLSESSNVKII